MWKRRNVANITVVTITVMDAVWSKFTRGARVATVFSCNIILTKKHFDNQWDWVKMNVWHSFGCLKMWRWMLTWGEFTSPATRAATLSGHVIAVAPVPAEKNQRYQDVKALIAVLFLIFILIFFGSKMIPAAALAHATSTKSSWKKTVKEKQQFSKVFTEFKTNVWNVATFFSYNLFQVILDCALRSLKIFLVWE